MEHIPIPSHIHYELLLQLLERQTLPAIASSDRFSREQIQSTIVMLRKALALQKQFESICEQQGKNISYRWSLNDLPLDSGRDLAEYTAQKKH
ncbi:DUF5340 family protein [Pseudanabaena sp. PCC 6802]|uniref:DUF5340 family protein n=1 Tax=Pseudanabaena sp. PCC 6802 TaxID=118173 RepID=UPI0003499580|nr:DUF5340 family protein [Pseudanabaena sp. PCC 6802]